jgi:hypothetical protein
METPDNAKTAPAKPRRSGLLPVRATDDLPTLSNAISEVSIPRQQSLLHRLSRSSGPESRSAARRSAFAQVSAPFAPSHIEHVHAQRSTSFLDEMTATGRGLYIPLRRKGWVREGEHVA